MIDIEGEWSGHITGTNNANVFVEFSQNGITVLGTARINDPVYRPAVYKISGAISSETLQLELHPDMEFFNKPKLQSLKVNNRTIMVESPPDTGHGIVTVNGKIVNGGHIDGSWKSTIGTGGKVFLAKIQPITITDQATRDGATKQKKVFLLAILIKIQIILIASGFT
jgi:hypothetical protein